MGAVVTWGFILILFIGFWVLAGRSTRKQRDDMARMQDGLEVGDEVVTGSGIYGSIHQLADTRVGLEIAPGVVIEMARQAVVRKVDPTEDAMTDVEQDEDAEAGEE